MEITYEIDRDSQGRITRVSYKNDRLEDPDGRNQLELLEFLRIVEKSSEFGDEECTNTNK